MDLNNIKNKTTEEATSMDIVVDVDVDVDIDDDNNSKNNTIRDKNAVVADKDDIITNTTTTTSNNNKKIDNEQEENSYFLPINNKNENTIKENEYIYLQFNDGKQYFTQAVLLTKNNKIPLKINKRSYTTSFFIGLQYGSVIEIQHNKFKLLDYNEDLFPDIENTYDFDDVEEEGDVDMMLEKDDKDSNDIVNGNGYGDIIADTDEKKNENNTTSTSNSTTKLDNRNLVDDNKAQTLCTKTVQKLKNDKTLTGQQIINTLIKNSSSFGSKTQFSKIKYIKRKQKKHQLRFRIIQTTIPTICNALYTKDARKIHNIRNDTLAQILNYGNVYAGSSVLIFETSLGLITGAVTSRLGGYGTVYSVYTTQQQPGYIDFLNRFNFNFSEWNSIHWLFCNDIFHNDASTEEIDHDEEALERNSISWPPPIQSHTREYLKAQSLSNDEQYNFLLKRAKRFARKLTRPTTNEILTKLKTNLVTTLIISINNYDPIQIFEKLFVYLKPSCNFIISCEYIEPLTLCFQYIKENNIPVINLRLIDTWLREFQVDENRTHPVMNTSQSGGYLLTGIKLASSNESVDEGEQEEEELKKMEYLKEELKRHRKNSRDGKRKRTRIDKERKLNNNGVVDDAVNDHGDEKILKVEG